MCGPRAGRVRVTFFVARPPLRRRRARSPPGVPLPGRPPCAASVRFDPSLGGNSCRVRIATRCSNADPVVVATPVSGCDRRMVVRLHHRSKPPGALIEQTGAHATVDAECSDLVVLLGDSWKFRCQRRRMTPCLKQWQTSVVAPSIPKCKVFPVPWSDLW